MQDAAPATHSALPPGSPPASLDAASLDALGQLDPSGDGAFLKKVMTTYLGSLDKQVAAARAASEQQLLDKVATAAHTLKASSASVGALVFSQLCGMVEGQIRRGDLEGLAPLLDQFFEEATRTRLAVVAHLGIFTS
jgi:HPt (histidine-containing phosphotransfer) domain-containing protein